MENRKHVGRTSKKIIVVRKILAQLQHLLQIVERRSSKYEENRRALEVLLKSLLEIKSAMKTQEQKLTANIEMIWAGIEETALCLKSLEEVTEFDKENGDDVYLPCYKRLDGVVGEYNNRKVRRWTKLRNKLEVIRRAKEDKLPYRSSRQWEVIKFHFDSDDDCRIVDDPFAEIPEKRIKLQPECTNAKSSKSSTSQTIKVEDQLSEDDENFAKFLESEAKLFTKPKSLVMTLKTVPNATTTSSQSTKVSQSNQDVAVVQSLPTPVLQELSLNTKPEELTQPVESIPSQLAVLEEPVVAVQPSSISNLQVFTGPMYDTFEEMGLTESLICGINLWGIVNPTIIQKKGLPLCLMGRDLVIQAPMGEGKMTLAAIAALNKISSEISTPQAIFLLPTPEKAEVTMGAIADLGTLMSVTSACCKYPEGLDSCNIFLGTPISTHSFITNRKLNTDRVKMLVIDGGDIMSLEARSLILKVLYNLGGDTQILILVHEITQEIECLTQKLRSPVYINCSTVISGDIPPDKLLAEPNGIENEVPVMTNIDFQNMNQFYVIVATDELKIRVLAALTDTMETEQAIIFCNTAQKADWLARKIRENEKGLEVCSLHGGRQNKDYLMTLFQAGVARVLITTDCITRSNFKVKPVPLVLNYEFPEFDENYIRRLMCAGRTKKLDHGSNGDSPVLVFNFVTLDNLPILESLAKKHAFTITPMSSQTT